ncbi:hypothetical protein FRC98_08675 [Lujinxingia vulgaris]|uniref:Uncharacterized protein n=1 Tax=Lujinxingia vulgaris TaxID=2600176 RepID=A0A5C6XDA6_9DELT|nr:hypothetical protein [Lujinxingia vulgaris]TXD37751.1 hypothetical protein FRC98_08675 [Lujinxingia vulgaris]
MVTDPRQTVKDASARSWEWVKRKTFNPLPFYRRAWEILKHDPWVFLWKMLADLLGRTANLALLAVAAAIVALDLQHFAASGGALTQWLDRFTAIASSPAFIAGLTGAIFCVALIGAALEALVTGGIWGMLAAGLRDEPIEKLRTFGRVALRRFPDVFALFLLRFAVRLVTICIAAAVAIGLANAFASPEFAGLGTFGKALTVALPLSFIVSWFALTRLVLEVIGAPMIIDDLSLGEAVLEAAAFVLDNFWPMYRLFIYALGLLLVPLGLYWVVLMAQNFAITWPALAAPLALLRFAGEVLMWASISVLGVLFYGAVFAFYRKDDRFVEEEERRSGAHAAVSNPDPQRNPTEPTFHEGVTLADLLPQEAPHRFAIDDLLPPDEAPPSPAQDHDDNDSRADEPSASLSSGQPSAEDDASRKDADATETPMPPEDEDTFSPDTPERLPHSEGRDAQADDDGSSEPR